MQHLLDSCRSTFRDPPRFLSLLAHFTYLRLQKPPWLKPNDDINLLFRGYRRLLRHGIIVWGHIVQANQLMFRPGPTDCPGEVVYCTDPLRQVNPAALAPIANQLFKLKGTAPRQPDLASIANYLTHERIRVFGLPVPASLSPSLPCAISTILFHRPHLPSGFLSKSYFPILIAPQSPRLALTLPARYWPPELTTWWLRK